MTRDQRNFKKLCEIAELQTRVMQEDSALQIGGKDLGRELIKWVLEKTGWTKTELARRMCVTNVYISFMLSGESKFSLSTIKRLSDAYAIWRSEQ